VACDPYSYNVGAPLCLIRIYSSWHGIRSEHREVGGALVSPSLAIPTMVLLLHDEAMIEYHVYIHMCFDKYWNILLLCLHAYIQ
jgi:hypothetical protein